MRGGLKRLLAAAAVSLLPSLAFAQGTLTGTVKDAVGRSAAGRDRRSVQPRPHRKDCARPSTDGAGQYRIIESESRHLFS